MRHFDCINYINLDCEKGMCALDKVIVPIDKLYTSYPLFIAIDGEGSEGCPRFEAAPKCGNCKNFSDPDKYGIGTCSGYEKENWAYATCGAYSCEKYAR